MSDDVKNFSYYADAAERIISGITEDMPVLDVAAVAACAQVFATLAVGAPKAYETIDPEPCGALHRIEDGDGHAALNSGTWCRFVHGHAGNHRCMAGHDWENKS